MYVLRKEAKTIPHSSSSSSSAVAAATTQKLDGKAKGGAGKKRKAGIDDVGFDVGDDGAAKKDKNKKQKKKEAGVEVEEEEEEGKVEMKFEMVDEDGEDEGA